MFSETDHTFMQQALALAERGMYITAPNPRVGCVIVRDGHILGTGFTQPAGGNHAEIQALADAALHGHNVSGATAYVTLEPCSHFGRTPPCADALAKAGISRVIAAMEDPNPKVSGGGLQRLRAAGIEVRCGLLEKEARELNIGFVSRMTRGTPWVRLKIAASLDGTTALANGVSQWITGEPARADGHRWRARACAILTGIGTVREDDPMLTVRAIDIPRQPLRILIDSRLEVSPQARMLSTSVGPAPLVFCADDTGDAAPRAAALRDIGIEVIPVADARGKVDLPAVLRVLGERGVNELHIEAGFKLNGSLLREACVDELLMYLAPTLLGPGRAMFDLPLLDALDQRIPLHVHEVRQIGDDIRVLARLGSSSTSQR
jgi:diaminohydroxyphosphoribosylaminopyrimidine deaminase/5-amino-6-(5-phosphoribosylamino)uracil reductase